MTFRMDRIEAAVVGSIRSAVPLAVVAWARSLYPNRNVVPVVTAAVARGPSFRTAEIETVDSPTALRWALASVAEGRRVGVSITGARWYVDTPATPTITGVRDALLAIFETDEAAEYLPGVTIAADGADGITFDADSVPGLLHRPVALGVSTLTTTETVEAETSDSVGVVVVELQAFSPGGGSDALSLLAQINGAQAMTGPLDTRQDLGISLLGIAEPVDLTSIAGAQWQSRASCRWTLSGRFHAARAGYVIDTIGTEAGSLVTVYDGVDPITFDLEIVEP